MSYFPPVSPYAAGLGCKCPRCGQGALFEGYLSLRAACSTCALDYSSADSGDGPAVFTIFAAGFLGVSVAFIARYVWFAPMWLAFALSAGVVIGFILLTLRPMKATLIALQFANKAAEGKLDR